MRIAVILLGVVAAVTVPPLSCGPSQPAGEPAPPPSAVSATPDSVRDQVLALVQQYYADLNARNWPRYESYFWPGATVSMVWPPPGEDESRVLVMPVAEFVRQAPQGAGRKTIFEEHMTSSEVRATSELAIVWAHYDAQYSDSTPAQHWSGIDAFTLVRLDGHWRIASLAWVSDAKLSR